MQAYRRYTPWHEYADGVIREAEKGVDFDTLPDTWARSGRSWAKRHDCTPTFTVRGNTVRFQLLPNDGGTVPDVPAPAARARGELDAGGAERRGDSPDRDDHFGQHPPGCLSCEARAAFIALFGRDGSVAPAGLLD